MKVNRRNCEHNKRKSTCRICSGSSYCKHGKVKGRCRECGGVAFCEHGRHKMYCVPCGGSQICKHGKRKIRCRECKGSGICKHGNQKDICKICKGSQLCKHNKQRRYCVECGGSGMCEHGKVRNTCVLCGGSRVCIHGKQKRYCRECDGSAYCEHDRERKTCVQCSPHHACNVCKSQYVPKNHRYYPLCTRCYFFTHPGEKVTRNYKTKETYLKDELTDRFTDLNMIFDKKVDGGCSRRKPDVLIDLLTHVLIIECDERQHKDVSYSCENKRTMELFEDFGNRPIVFLRFNPDSYNDRMKHVKGCFTRNERGIDQPCKREWKRRLKVLFSNIHHWVETIPEKEVTVVRLFFDVK